MSYNTIEPEAVFHWFKEISDIPRGSGNEAAVAAYVEAFAKERGLFVLRDGNNNVFVRKPASDGRERAPVITLQGHLDMVCEANGDVVHDFRKDPIQLKLEGDILSAEGTTLGADNGVAVAMMMALLDDDCHSLPGIECLFTTEEETGLTGMTNFDASVVEGRRMINLDSAGEGVATVSCAGGVRSNFTFLVEKTAIPAGYTALSMRVTGLAGGHSGEDIDLGRMNGILGAARLLTAAKKASSLLVVSVNGGSKDNAIPRECEIVFAVDKPAEAKAGILAEYEAMKLSLAAEDGGFAVELAETGAETCMANGDRLLSLIHLLPVGVRTMSRSIPGLVETSANLGVIRTEEDVVRLTVSSRSSVSTELDWMEGLMEEAAALSGCTELVHKSRYPGWDFTKGSALQQLYLTSYRELFGTEAKVAGIHAGLECGIFKQKVPDMDIISIGPVIKDLHSPDETLSVSSLERLWKLLLRMLERV